MREYRMVVALADGETFSHTQRDGAHPMFYAADGAFHIKTEGPLPRRMFVWPLSRVIHARLECVDVDD